MESADFELLAQAALAAAMGFLIGWVRERRGSAAGDRNYALVALGAAAFTTVGLSGSRRDAGDSASRRRYR